MRKSLVIKIILSLIILHPIAFYCEKYVKFKNFNYATEIQNNLIHYSFSQIMSKPHPPFKEITRAFLKSYKPLIFLIVRDENKIIFAVNRKLSYNNIFSSTLNAFEKKNQLKQYTLKKKYDTFKFIITSLKKGTLLTAYVFPFNPYGIIVRNILISLLLFSLGLMRYRKKKKENFSSMLKEESQTNSVNPNIEKYRILYEDNQKLMEEIENLSSFREVGLALNSILNFEQMLHVIMDTIIMKINVQKIYIYLINDKKNQLHFYIGRDGHTHLTQKEILDEKIIMGEGIFGKAMEIHSSLIVNNRNESFILTPLITNGELMGAIKIENKLDETFFNTNDKETLRLLSSQISLALNNAKLYEMAITDGLTKLFVHRHFQFKIQEELQRHHRNNKPLSLILLDIDKFKECNDTYGHLAGDYILQEIASMIKSLVRTTDFVFRYGGEELSILLPETNSENTYSIAEKIRQAIENHDFQLEENNIKITISLGISTYQPNNTKRPLKEEVIKMADQALYFSKNSGRNKTTLYTPYFLEETKHNEESLGLYTE